MKKGDPIPKIAILVSTSSHWGRQIVKGILSYANEVGPWHIWVKESTPGVVHELPSGWHGDGIIARVVSESLAREITEAGIPVVNVADSEVKGFSAPCIRTDDRAGAKMAIRHFLDRGFRKLCFTGPINMPNPAWYAEAFQKEAAANGLSCEIFPMDGNMTDFIGPLTQWLHELPKPIGLLAWGHGHAREVVDCCLEADISVPHDVAVLGGGYDELLCNACFPALSGIITPTEQIGYQAAKLLHEQIMGAPRSTETIYVPPLGIVEHLSTDTLAVKDPKLLQVIEYLRGHALEPITMKDILEAVPMARRSLERRFHQAFGRSPNDEILRIRINKARMLLAETDLPMQEIAEACGYATYNYLTHIFKKSTGSTPRDFRKRYRT